jgi:sugar phosphate isomerase/epimerase
MSILRRDIQLHDNCLSSTLYDMLIFYVTSLIFIDGVLKKLPDIFLSHNPQFNPLSEVVSLCRFYGFGIEMAAFSEVAVLNDAEQIALHRSATRGITGRALHAPYLELYPGSPDSDVRKATFDCFEHVYLIAVRLGAAHIIFHHNYDPSACSESAWLENSCAFWHKFLSGKSSSVQIHLENIMDKNPELISELVRRIDSPQLDIALDIGHAHAYSRVTPLKWVESLKGQIGYVHLHDNHGQEDEHLALGDGNIPLKETIKALRNYVPNAVWSIESGGEKMLRSMEWIMKNNYIGKL